jgi:site-specific recombinase XerD
MSRKPLAPERTHASHDCYPSEPVATGAPFAPDETARSSAGDRFHREPVARDPLPLHQKFLTAGAYLRNWSRTTLRTYGQALHRLELERPTTADLDAWVIRLRQQGLSPGGVNMYARAVNSYLTWLHEDGHVNVRLKIKLLRAPLRQHTLLTAAEVAALVRFRPRTLAERRTHALILLLLDTGSSRRTC